VVLEKSMLRIVFGLKGDKVTRILKTLHNDELRNLKSSPSIIRIVKSWRMRWAGRGQKGM
jgi:hypothetical protein